MTLSDANQVATGLPWRHREAVIVLGLGQLASHRDDPQYVAFAFATVGVCGCAYFVVRAWGRLSGGDPPSGGWVVVLGGFVLSALLLFGGMAAIAWLETPAAAMRVSASIVILLAGILCAFVVAMSFSMGENEVLGYAIGVAILILMVVVLSQVLPSY